MSETITTAPSTSIKLSMTLSDGGTGSFPRIRVYDENDVLDATVDLSHVALGYYDGAYTTSATRGRYHAIGIVYSDAGHTTKDTTYSQTETLIITDLDSTIWNAQASVFNTTGTMGAFQNLLPVISSSVSFIEGIEAGTWRIIGSQMIFYASGTNAELARFDLKDAGGSLIDPTTENPFQRVRT